MSATIYWLASYPKSGNTWFRVFLTNLKSGGEKPASINELDTEGIASGRDWLDDMLGVSTADLTPEEITLMRPHVYQWSSHTNTKSTHIKVHDANYKVAGNQYLFPMTATAGVIYIIRNPLDVVISLAHHNTTTIDKAIARLNNSAHKLAKFKNHRHSLQVEQRVLSWSRHVESWVDNEGLNTLTIRYEDMQTKPQKTFALAANHLGITFDAPALDQAIDNSAFDKLRAQEEETPFKERPPRVSKFFRIGRVGNWRENLTASQIEQVIESHEVVMRRFGYLDERNRPK